MCINCAGEYLFCDRKQTLFVMPEKQRCDLYFLLYLKSFIFSPSLVHS
jgi:hypothetical protein